MALVVADRVLETSSTAGTGTLTLSGAPAGYVTFSSRIGNGNTTYYTIYDSVAAVWEVGLGTIGASTLSRDTVLSNSSGTTSPITLAGNTISVWCDYPAGKAVYADSSNNVTLGGNLTVTGTTTLATSLTGVLKSSSGVVSNAVSGTDYLAPPSGAAILKANSGGALANATAGTDYSAGTSALATGLIKSTTSTGALSIAVSGTDYAPATSGASILSGSGSGGFSNVTIGTGLSFSGGTLSNTVTSPFAAGTAIIFAQAAAPTGWTQSTTHNNKALRLVSGTGGGSGGSVAFTTAFASQTPSGSINTAGLSAGATTLATTQIPSHSHTVGLYYNANGSGVARAASPSGVSGATDAAGGGGSHSHSLSGSATFTGTAINLAVQYVDVIICTKD